MNADAAIERALIWQNLLRPGSEHCELRSNSEGSTLRGTVIAGLEERRVLRVAYSIHCDREWRTRRVEAEQMCGTEACRVALEADGHGMWLRDGREASSVAGCIDIDLSITPATNTLPIRRLNLAIGAQQSVIAAWLRFPELTLLPLAQTYTRLEVNRYRYESDTGFSTEITVDELGLVVSYPPGWERVAGQPS